jgi:hypothetical protein
MSPFDVSVHSEIWDCIVDWEGILSLWMEVLTAFGTVADWVALNEIFLINFNISLPKWGQVLWGTSYGIFAFWMSV